VRFETVRGWVRKLIREVLVWRYELRVVGGHLVWYVRVAYRDPCHFEIVVRIAVVKEAPGWRFWCKGRFTLTMICSDKAARSHSFSIRFDNLRRHGKMRPVVMRIQLSAITVIRWLSMNVLTKECLLAMVPLQMYCDLLILNYCFCKVFEKLLYTNKEGECLNILIIYQSTSDFWVCVSCSWLAILISWLWMSQMFKYVDLGNLTFCFMWKYYSMLCHLYLFSSF